MKRQNWLVELTKYINSQLGQPFEWGVRDCTTFALECVEVMLGHGLVKPAFTYTNRAEAVAFAQVHSVEQGLIEQCNAYHVPAHTAKAGDLILLPHDGLTACHVCAGKHSVIPHPERGVMTLPTKVLTEQLEAVVLRID